MAMSDCEKCYETPCICGYSYGTWTLERLKDFRNTIDIVIKVKEAEKAREFLKSTGEDHDHT